MSFRKRLLILAGTRPEAIKLAPVVRAARSSSRIQPALCFTAQHRDLLDQMAATLELRADIDLDLMQPDQALPELTARVLLGVSEVLRRDGYSGVVAQGDTTTVMAGSIAAFLNRVPFFHVEAGLRSGDLNNPWPEEYHRRVAGIGAAIHFAPTEAAASHLRNEGIPDSRVRICGNTVIDSLLWMRDRVAGEGASPPAGLAALEGHPFVLITAHRRESFGPVYEGICRGIARLARAFPAVEFVFPVHPNPAIQRPVRTILGPLPNCRLLHPCDYGSFVWLMDRCLFILTDSGGIQEEAPSLRKPVLVLRETTERPEAIAAGAARLAGTCPDSIYACGSELLADESARHRMIVDRNPYGDGRAAQRIVGYIADFFTADAPTARPRSSPGSEPLEASASS